MEIKTCKMCGKIYNNLGANTPLCPSCMRHLEDKFDIVKEYIYDNPNSNIQDVSKNTEVPIRQIKQWVKEERLSFAEGSLVGVECEGCGAMILTGRYCAACKGQLTNELGNAIRKPEVKKIEKDKREQARMRFLDN